MINLSYSDIPPASKPDVEGWQEIKIVNLKT